MKPSKIRPDIALKELLAGQIVLQRSDSESANIKVYAQGERPNDGLDTEFVEILFNGVVRSLTKPMGAIKGNLAICIYVKTYEDGSVFQYRVDSLMEIIEDRVSDMVSSGYFFEINHNNIMTPTTVNITTGYSTTILNIGWHTM